MQVRGEQEKPTVFTENIKSCPSCSSKNIVRLFWTGEIYCAECGLVLA